MAESAGSTLLKACFAAWERSVAEAGLPNLVAMHAKRANMTGAQSAQSMRYLLAMAEGVADDGSALPAVQWVDEDEDASDTDA